GVWRVKWIAATAVVTACKKSPRSGSPHRRAADCHARRGREFVWFATPEQSQTMRRNRGSIFRRAELSPRKSSVTDQCFRKAAKSMSPVYQIAIADADALVLRFLRQCVERAGHEVAVEAVSGPALIEECRSVPPDLIVADIEILGVDGFEAVR